MAHNPAKTREEFELSLSARAATDANFRKALFTDPKSTLERELGQQLSPTVRVHVVEETQEDLYVVLRRPPRKTSGSDEEGLSAEELDNVAGGIGTSAYYSSNTLSLYGSYFASGGFEKGGGTGGFTSG